MKNKFLNTVRAGNVIGGGDWSENRILPDIFRAYYKNKSLKIRNPKAIRPWSYVLDMIECIHIIFRPFLDNYPVFLLLSPTAKIVLEKSD